MTAPYHSRPRHGRGALWLVLLLFVVMIVAGVIPRLRHATARRQEQADVAAIPTVYTEPVVQDTASAVLDLSGTISGLHETSIYARTNAFVKSLRVDLGSVVRAGDTLVVLDMPDISEQVRQAKAAVDQADATVQLTRSTLTRWKALSDKGVVTPQELDEKQGAYNVAEANARAVRASLGNLEEVQRFGALTAPFSGVITTRSIDQGSLVSAGAVTGNRPLLTLVQVDTLRVFLNVPQSVAPQIHVGQDARITVQELGTRAFPGVVARTASAIDPATRTLLTEVHVTNGDHRLLPGMLTHVGLKVPASGTALRIPAIALIVRADGPQVARVDSGTVTLVPVKLGRDYGTSIEVLDGIGVGAQLVVNPTEQLTTGARVHAIAHKGTKPAP